MAGLEKKLYHLKLDPNMHWFSRPEGKCSKDFYTEKVSLLVNWFKFTNTIYDRDFYEYDVQMYKLKSITNRRSGKTETKKTIIAIPERSELFWKHLRHEQRYQRENQFDIEDYVFDGKDTVYSVNLHENQVMSTMIDQDKPNLKYVLELSFRLKFRLNFSRENPLLDEEANRSYKFLKVVMTQKVRYPPCIKENIESEFAKNFVYDSNSILRVPESFHDPGRFEYSLQVAPRIEAWFGIYIGIKELFDGEPVIHFAIVDKLFYNAPKMSLLDYLLLLVDSDTQFDSVRKDQKEKLKNGNMSISASAKPKINRLLENLKLKCTEVWDEAVSRMSERHLSFIELIAYNSKEYEVPVPSRRGRDAPKNYVPLFEVYKNNQKYIEFPYLPLVKVKSGAKEYHVPIEYLEVHEKPQRYKNRIDLVMQKKFLDRATRKPHNYKQKTIEMLKDLDLSSDTLNFVKRFGLDSDLKMITCPGKVLKEPMLVNKNNKKISMTPVVRGFQEKQLNVVPEKELCCALFVFRDGKRGNDSQKQPCLDEKDAYKFYKALIDGCEFRGMRIGKHENAQARSVLCDKEKEKYAFYNDVTFREGVKTFEVAAQDAKAMFDRLPDKDDKILLFVVISDPVSDVYGFIKHHCDVTLGIASQHITSSTAKKALNEMELNKPSKRIFYQIALKINAKLGGVNQELDYSESGEISPEEKERRKTMPLTMYVGIDVTHPTTGSGLDFSIAAVVASINPSGTRYRNMIVTQEECFPGERPVAHGRERTDILEGKFVQLLRVFAEHNNNRAPDHIVVYRDGVSDSEMLRVSHDELRSLKGEVKQFLRERHGDNHTEPNPKYTFVVVQKRHRTRLLRKIEAKRPNDKDAGERWDEDMRESENTGIVNPHSGTVVDKVIVSKYKFDYFLASHHGVLGTSRPGHYTVMYDDMNMTMDQVYKMTYELAFLSARCRKPISLPAPVHYAHLSCEKAKGLYRSWKEHVRESLPYKPTRQQIEEYLQTNSRFPGMPFV